MVDMLQAIQIAKKMVLDLYGDEIENVRLEEIQSSEQDTHWLVTIGFRGKSLGTSIAQQANPLAGFLSSGRDQWNPMGRVMKVVHVRKSDGKPDAMTNRAA